MVGNLLAQESPCENETYIELKKKKLDEMSDREYEYFLVKDKQCNEYISNPKNKKSYVPEELRPVYGVTDPCDNPMLKYTMEEIRALNDLDINLYDLHSEKCDSSWIKSNHICFKFSISVICISYSYCNYIVYKFRKFINCLIYH